MLFFIIFFKEKKRRVNLLFNRHLQSTFVTSDIPMHIFEHWQTNFTALKILKSQTRLYFMNIGNPKMTSCMAYKRQFDCFTSFLYAYLISSRSYKTFFFFVFRFSLFSLNVLLHTEKNHC